MKKAFASIESCDLLYIIRHGYIPCLLLLMFGVIVTVVWSNRLQKTLEPPRYNRGIYINLNGLFRDDAQLPFYDHADDEIESLYSIIKTNDISSEDGSMNEFVLFNVPHKVGVMLFDERQAYSNLMNAEKSGPLSVRNYAIKSTGVLNFDVGVSLKEDDQRIVALIDKMNFIRNGIVTKLKNKLSMLEKRRSLLNAAISQLKKKDSRGSNKEVISVLHGENEFIGILATEIQDRLPAIRKPIKVPTLKKMLPVNTYAKRILACALATMICSILAGFIFGLARLMRQQAVQDADSAAVLPP